MGHVLIDETATQGSSAFFFNVVLIEGQYPIESVVANGIVRDVMEALLVYVAGGNPCTSKNLSSSIFLASWPGSLLP